MSEDWVENTQEKLRRFAEERDWERYHTPQNLAASISSEAGELLALFRWGQDAVGSQGEEVEAELADVLLGVLRFADVARIDLQDAVRRKLELNAQNYPTGRQEGPDR